MSRYTLWVMALLCALLMGCGGAMKASRAEQEPSKANAEESKRALGGKATNTSTAPKARPEVVSESVEVTSGGDTFEGDTFDEGGDEVREEVDELAAEIKRLEQEALQGPEERGRGCEEICELSEAICASSGKICDIYADHPADTYIHDRCVWSEKECREANSRCTVCEP